MYADIPRAVLTSVSNTAVTGSCFLCAGAFGNINVKLSVKSIITNNNKEVKYKMFDCCAVITSINLLPGNRVTVVLNTFL